jgi:hypothetical protein
MGMGGQNTPNNQLPQGGTNPMQYIHSLTSQPTQALQQQQQQTYQQKQFAPGGDQSLSSAISQYDRSTGQNIDPNAPWQSANWDHNGQNSLHAKFNDWYKQQYGFVPNYGNSAGASTTPLNYQAPSAPQGGNYSSMPGQQGGAISMLPGIMRSM